MNQICRVCDEDKPFSDFYKNKNYKSGHATICKLCSYKQLSDWRSIEENRRSEKIRLHGLSPEQYLVMLEGQQHRCAICKRTQEETNEYLYIDHDHSCCPGKFSCGKCVRGLLCKKCNMALGFFEDSLDRIKEAMIYLKG